MQQEIRAMLAHGGEGEHAVVVRVDAPALSGNVAAPDETDVAAIGRRGAEPPDHRLAFDADMREVAKPDTVEDLLPPVVGVGVVDWYWYCRHKGHPR